MTSRLLAPLAVVALALLAAPVAEAQPTVGNPFSVVITDTALSSYSFSRGDCANTTQVSIPFSWTATVPFVGPNETEAVFLATSTTCTRPTDATKLLVDRGRTIGQPTEVYPPSDGSKPDLTVAELFTFISSSAACGGDTGIESDIFLCVAIKGTPLGGTETTRSSSVKFRLDSKPPTVPTITAVNAREGALEVVWTMPSTDTDAAHFKVYVKPSGGEERAAVVVTGSATRTTVIDGLDNDIAYEVTMTSVDDAGSSGRTATFGNESARSAAMTGTPMTVQDFMERYVAAGGTDAGGCGTASPFLLLLPFAAFRRRRSRRGAAALFTTGLFAVALFAAPARADTSGGVSIAQPRSERMSPQRFTLELRTGSYAPSIDKEAGLGGKTPYKDIFGTGTPLLSRLEFDFDFAHTIIGRFGIGASVGTWEVSGKGRYPSSGDSVALDVVTMNLMPVTALLSWRVDVFYDRFGIPLIPYAKVGYGFAYWTSKVNGTISTAKLAEGTTVSAEGWGRGLEFGGGLQLALDGLEPNQAVALDRDWGINSTLLFVEAQANTFTGAGGLRLDGWTIGGGLALAF